MARRALPDGLKHRRVLGARAVREIQPHDVDASMNQRLDALGRAGGRPECRDDLRAARARPRVDRVQVGRTLLLFTGGDVDDVEDLSQIINIVGKSPTETESRIVHSIGQEEGSRFLDGNLAGENPWLARARSNLQVMYRTALAVSHTLDIDQLLRRIMDLIFEWVEADRGCIMLVDHETEELLPKARRTRQS